MILQFVSSLEQWQQLEPSFDMQQWPQYSVCSLGQWQSWLNANQAGAHLPSNVGMWLEPQQQPQELAPCLDQLSTIWLQFPRFNDGRQYSNATLLRRLGYKGQLVAFGDVLVDQVLLMSRCGFDVALLRADQSMEAAQASLQRFSDFYQADAQQALPAFRRGRELSAPAGKAA